MIPISKPIMGEEEINAVSEVLRSGMIAQGKKTGQLEKEFAELCGTRYGIAVNSGTAALHAALFAVGVGEGDEVITTPHTFQATGNVIRLLGAKPVFADIDPETYNISPNEIEKAVTDKTKAIVPVHLYGQCADMDEILEIAEGKKIEVVEDACQAHSAQYKGKTAGSFGKAAAFSFYATKNMTCGEGGIVTTDDKEVDRKVREYRHHGTDLDKPGTYEFVGYNYRMTDINAAIGIEQLRKLSEFNARRKENAETYNRILKDVEGIEIPVTGRDRTHIYHLYTIRVGENYKLSRDELIAKLKGKEIGAGVYYPVPIHLQKPYLDLGYKEGSFPNAEKACREILSLPVHAAVGREDAEKIAKLIGEFNG